MPEIVETPTVQDMDTAATELTTLFGGDGDVPVVAPDRDPTTGRFKKADDNLASDAIAAAGQELEPEPEKKLEKKLEKEPEKEAEAEQNEPEPDSEKPDFGKWKHRVKADGIEQDVDYTELVGGYQKGRDYTQKTMHLAKERDAFEAERVEHVKVIEAYRSQLETLAALIPNPGAEPDWELLRNELTPEDFSARFTEHRAAIKRVNIVQEQRQRAQEKLEQEYERQLDRDLTKAHERIGEMIPEWKDPEKGKQLKSDLIAYAKSDAYGYSDNDLAMVTDPRLIVVLNKARLWDESQKRKPTLQAKLERAVDTVRPSASPPKPLKGKTFADATNRLSVSGSVEDGVAALTALGIK